MHHPPASSDGILAGPIDAPARLASSYPATVAHPRLRVLHRASGFTGALVTLDGEEVVLQGQTGLERRFPNQPGAFAVDGTAVRLVAPTPLDTPPPARISRERACRRRPTLRRGAGPCSAPGPGLLAPPASSWRACTMPSSWNTCGEMTCASKASWWSASTAPTTWPPHSADAAWSRSPRRRAPRSSRRGQQGGTNRACGRASERARDRYALRRRLAGRATLGSRNHCMARDTQGHRLEDGGMRGAGRRGASRVLAADPRVGPELEGPRAAIGRRGRGADRLRHR